MFEAVLQDKAGLEEGTSVALATLLRIFTRDRGTFLSVHLASFYSCLEKILLKDINDKVLSTALLNSRGLFVRELQGSFTLLPHYFHAFSRVWRENGPEPNIRSACIDILATLVRHNNPEVAVTIGLTVGFFFFLRFPLRITTGM